MFHSQEEIVAAIEHNDSFLSTVHLDAEQCIMEDLAPIFQALCDNRSVVSLYIKGYHIGAGALFAMGEMLQRNKSLAHLTLHQVSIGDEGGHHLVRGIAQSTSLESVQVYDLSKNGRIFHAIGVAVMDSKSVTSLSVISLRSDVRHDDSIALHFSTTLRHNTRLRYFQFASFRLSKHGSAALAQGLCGATGLTHFDLSYTVMKAEEARFLSMHLGSTRLGILDLQGCRLGNTGIDGLVRGYRHCSTLQFLRLTDNCITNKGVEALCQVLKLNPLISELNLSDNQIGDAGLRFIGQMLKSNTRLKRLDLSCNRFGSCGTGDLAEGMKNNCGMSTLLLGHNGLYDEAIIELLFYLQDNNVLCTLDLSNNRLSPTYCKRISGDKRPPFLHALIVSPQEKVF
jgi:Ran GTPase-activating protein (RanGAP) involved in mRNA processing and transport